MSCGGDSVKRQSGRGIAGDHQQLRPLIFQEIGGLYRVTRHGFYRFRAVGKARCISEIEVVGYRE